MSLYCLRCKKMAYRNHNPDCTPQDVISLTKEMRPLADSLHYLGFELLSASCYTYPAKQSVYEHRITLQIEFRKQYPMLALGEIPVGWKYYTETGTDDHWPISVLAYIETYMWPAYETVEKRISQIVTELTEYLGTRDKVALQSIMMLMD